MSTNQSVKDYFRTLTILFYALVSGQVIFMLIILYLIMSGMIENEFANFKQILFLIVPFIALAGIYASQYIFRLKMNDVKNKPLLSEKLADYRSASIVRWAILEAPSFFAIIAAFITSDILFLGIGAIIIVWFITIKPGLERTVSDIELDFNDKMLLENPDSIIQ